MIWIKKEIIQLVHNYLSKTDSGDQHARPITQNARRQAEFTGDRASQRNGSRIDNRVTALRSRINAGFVKKPGIFFTHCNWVATGARIFQVRINQPVELRAPVLSGNIFCLFSLLHPLKKWSLRQTRGIQYSIGSKIYPTQS